jgi:fatty-acyl-CoA synthase
MRRTGGPRGTPWIDAEQAVPAQAEMLYGHPSVLEAAVIGVPHEKWIEAVLAVVIIKQGHSITEEALLAHCKERLAHFKVPKRVLFVDELPKNPSGKLLKRELRQVYVNALQGPEVPDA